MPYGYLDTHYIDFPANIDVNYIEGLRTRSGMDFPTLLRLVDQRLAAFNTAIDPWVASLITATTEAYIDTTGPSAFTITERSQYTAPRPQMADGGAHMLPLRGWDVALGFTEDGLEAMTQSRILANIDSALLGLRIKQRKEVINRLFSAAEVRISQGLATTSPGFAGSGTGDNVFSRTTYPDGAPLPGSYTHYYTKGAGTLAAALKAAIMRLRMWHAGPFDLVAPQTEIDLITAINPGDPADGFVSAGSALVRGATSEAEAQVDPAMYLGVLFGDVRVHKPLTDFATTHIAVYKSYGNLVPQNPLAWRYDALKGRNAALRYRSMYPLDNAIVKQDFGIGVSDRTAAVLIYDDSGSTYSWTNI